jgi:protein gp37
VARILREDATVEKVRQIVSTLPDKDKKVPEPPAWMPVAEDLVEGRISPHDVALMRKAIESASVHDEDILADMESALESAEMHSLSAARAFVVQFERRQEDRDLQAQQATERARSRTAQLRASVSLETWGALSEDERRSLLTPVEGETGKAWNLQETTDIEWAQVSWNPVTGCEHGCPYCYARDIATSQKMRAAYPNGFLPTLRPASLRAPYQNKPPASAVDDVRQRNVFTCSMADLFGRWVPAAWIEAVLQSCADNPAWNFLMLTKFPKRMAEFSIPKNCWMGTTVDLNARVKAAEDAFEKVSCAVKWLSVEPMLEPIKFSRLALFDWLVIGGASRSSQTPEWFPPFDWIRQITIDAEAAGVPVYMKTNLGIRNRILMPPRTITIPIPKGETKPGPEFSYLSKRSR